jgi:protein-S-isoprenylcysteine O-methyltransferase Ste14
MYVVTIVMVIGIALGLGSWWMLLFLVMQMFVLPIRILDEEKVLENELVGYKEYERKVRYRLVPYF